MSMRSRKCHGATTSGAAGRPRGVMHVALAVGTVSLHCQKRDWLGSGKSRRRAASPGIMLGLLAKVSR
jgi:hypothetical protein